MQPMNEVPFETALGERVEDNARRLHAMRQVRRGLSEC